MSMSFRSRKIGDTILPFPGQRTLVAPDATPLLPVLIVLHQETSTPGRVGNALRALGYRLDIRRPRFGDPLPETLEGHAGAEADRKSTRLNSSHLVISYAVFCLKKKKMKRYSVSSHWMI